MCNLAEGIEERAIAKTQKEEREKAQKAIENAKKKAKRKATEKATKAASAKFIISMYQKGYTLDQIADVADISTNDVKSVIKKKSPAMA